MYAVGYVRVSTGEQYATPEVQEQKIVELCKSKGWELLGVYRDIGVSGVVDPFERDGFSEAVKTLADKGGGVLVVYAYDRLARSLPKMYETLSKLGSMRIFVYSIREQSISDMAYTNPSLFQFFLLVLGWAAEYERRLISERVRLAMENPEVREHIYEKFRWVTGYRLYNDIPEDVKEAVVQLYRLGWSYDKISRALHISKHHIRRILVEKNVISIPPDICPRCFHKLEIDKSTQFSPKRSYRCPNCGYVREEEM